MNRLEKQIKNWKIRQYNFKALAWFIVIPSLLYLFMLESTSSHSSYDFKRDSLLSSLFVEPISSKDKFYLEFKSAPSIIIRLVHIRTYNTLHSINHTATISKSLGTTR